MPPSARTDRAPVEPRRRFLLALAAASMALAAHPAFADEIRVKSASLAVADGELLLSADFDFSLTPALEQALEKGVPLYFTIEFELSRARPLWFPDKAVEWSITYRISYSS
ncbi:MAG TPA: DUF4390 domain-containing protein, partial [Casimicrobiaceae bacterium]|nr:DUF4390 domain-containing protein [Casimicrobiaceae bacterium]